MRPPRDGIPGVPADAIVELVKPVYGLVDVQMLVEFLDCDFEEFGDGSNEAG